MRGHRFCVVSLCDSNDVDVCGYKCMCAARRLIRVALDVRMRDVVCAASDWCTPSDLYSLVLPVSHQRQPSVRRVSGIWDPPRVRGRRRSCVGYSGASRACTVACGASSLDLRFTFFTIKPACGADPLTEGASCILRGPRRRRLTRYTQYRTLSLVFLT